MSDKKELKIPLDRIVLGFALAGFLIVSFLYAKDSGVFDKINLGSSSATDKKVKVDLYVMSQCPYGVQAMDGMKPAVDRMSDVIEYNINYIAQESAPNTFSSLHGENEVVGNKVELCTKKYDDKKHLDLIACLNKDYQNIPGNIDGCLTSVGVANVDKIKTCYNGDEGSKLLSENIKLANGLSVGGSPTYYVDGQKYEGGRDAASITKMVCSKINGEHSACKDMPVCSVDTDCTADAAKVGVCTNPGAKNAKCEYKIANKVDAILLNDKRCKDCTESAPQITDSLRTIFRGLVVKEVDYSDQEGQDLFKANPTLRFPAYLFAANVKDGEGFKSVEAYLTKAGDYSLLNIGASFDPTKKVCDFGNIEENCKSSECSDAMVCRKEIKQRLDVFVMSDCPYGNQAEDSMKEVLKNFGNNIDFHINYIADYSGTGIGYGEFQSLHGPYEAQQNMVEVCVNKYYPTKSFDFVTCMNAKGIKTTDWKTCANELAINTPKINKCLTGSEGTTLLSNNIKIAQALKVSSSPTWFVNNKYQGSALDAESIKKLFCQYNTGVKGCENTLTTTNSASANAAAGCGQ